MKFSKRTNTILSFCFFAVAAILCFTAYDTGLLHELTNGNPELIFAASPLVIKFTKDIQEGLYPDNEYYNYAINDDALIDGAEVRLPQAGAKPNVEKNRQVLPAPVAPRTDSYESYNIHPFTSDPVNVTITEELQVSYPKRQSILREHKSALSESVGSNLIVDWAPTLDYNIIRTTGTARAATSPGATGNRKMIAKSDFIKAFTIFNKWNVPMANRYCVLPPDMYADLLNISDFTDVEKFGRPGLPTGVVTEILGFKILIRSTTLVYTNASTPVKKDFLAAAATSDNLSALFYGSSFVRRALGSPLVLINEMVAEYYGTIMSAITHAGGRIARTKQEGVLALVEAEA